MISYRTSREITDFLTFIAKQLFKGIDVIFKFLQPIWILHFRKIATQN